MVLPEDLGDCAQNGDQDRVFAWLDAGGDINDGDSQGFTFDDEIVVAIKTLIAGVRKHGTYKKYMRAPHREFLAARGLAQRGKLRTDHPALAFLAKQGDNGVVWHILSYWRPEN